MNELFDIFISYSRKDKAICEEIQNYIEKFPISSDMGTNQKKIRVFRDDTDLQAHVDLTNSLQDALSKSDNLLVLCSPSSAKSEYVKKEIAFFEKLKGTQNILLILINGEPCDSIPDSIFKKVSDPFYVDLRSSNRKEFKLGLIKIIAGALNLPLDNLLRREEARQIKTRKKRMVIVTILSILFITSVIISGVDKQIKITKNLKNSGYFFRGPTCFDFRNNESIAIGTLGGSICLWNIKEDLHPDTIMEIGRIRNIFYPSIDSILVISSSNLLFELEIVSKPEIKKIFESDQEIHGVAEGRNKEEWLIGGGDGSVKIIDLKKELKIKEYLIASEPINWIKTFGHQTDNVLLNNDSMQLFNLNLETSKSEMIFSLLDTIGYNRNHNVPPIYQEVTRSIFYLTDDGVLFVEITGHVKKRFSAKKDHYATGFAVNEKTIAISYADGEILFFDFDNPSNKPNAKVQVQGIPFVLEFSNNGKLLAVGYEDNEGPGIGGVSIIGNTYSLWGIDIIFLRF